MKEYIAVMPYLAFPVALVVFLLWSQFSSKGRRRQEEIKQYQAEEWLRYQARLNSVMHAMRSGQVIRSLISSLRKPINRIGFIVFLAGIVMILAGLFAGLDAHGQWLTVERLFGLNGGYRQWWQTVSRWGFVLFISGAWFAWLYQSTLERLYLWIKG